MGGGGLQFWLGRVELFFRQVPKKSAGRLLVCMVVSRFLKFRIQISFSENVLGAQNALDLDWDPSGSGGYMRKSAASTDLKGKVLAAPLPLPNCLQNTIR